MRRSHLIALASVLALLLTLVGVAWATDHARRDSIAKGVTVGGIDVGGLSRAQANAKLERDLLGKLREPVVLQRAGKRWHLTASEAHVAVDVQGSVDRAIQRSRHGSFLTRSMDRVTGAKLHERVGAKVQYDDHAIVRLIDRVRKRLERPARDASVTFGADTVSPVASQSGLVVHSTGLHRRIREALASPRKSHTFTLHMRHVEPKITTAELSSKYPTIITVDRNAFRLRLFKNLQLVKTYTIAVGRQGLETPAGLYAIQDKQVNPSWHVPDSDWAGKLRGKTIPPGPDDPIKARWMGIFGGAGIHGVDPSEYGSLGSAASHGCVRMRIADVIELFDRVAVGTPVHIA